MRLPLCLAALAAAALLATPGCAKKSKTPPGDGRQVITVRSGQARIVLNGVRDRIYRGEGGGAVLRGNVGDGIDLVGCRNLRFEGIQVIGWYRGVRIRNSSGIELAGVSADRCQQQGFLGSNSDHLTFRRCESSEITGQHALYVGETFSDVLVEDSDFSRTNYSAVQFNAEAGEDYARHIRMVRTRINNPRFAMSVMGAEVTLEACEVNGRVNLDAPYGRGNWPARVTCLDTYLSGPFNVFGGSTLDRG